MGRKLTVSVEGLAEGLAFGHGNRQDEVLETRDAEHNSVFVVGKVLGGCHRAVQGDIPGIQEEVSMEKGAGLDTPLV